MDYNPDPYYPIKIRLESIQIMLNQIWRDLEHIEKKNLVVWED